MLTRNLWCRCRRVVQNMVVHRATACLAVAASQAWWNAFSEHEAGAWRSRLVDLCNAYLPTARVALALLIPPVRRATGPVLTWVFVSSPRFVLSTAPCGRAHGHITGVPASQGAR